MTPLEQLLTQIEAQCALARAALADEHEGDTRRAVAFIASDAIAALAVVQSW